MDTSEREQLLGELKLEMLRSLREALRYSRYWQIRQAALKAQYSSPATFRVIKRDDLDLKDFMSSYIWHRDNSIWAKSMIDMLKSEEVSRHGIPAQRG